MSPIVLKWALQSLSIHSRLVKLPSGLWLKMMHLVYSDVGSTSSDLCVSKTLESRKYNFNIVRVYFKLKSSHFTNLVPLHFS